MSVMTQDEHHVAELVEFGDDLTVTLWIPNVLLAGASERRSSFASLSDLPVTFFLNDFDDSDLSSGN
jgi:hypothetical protein